MKKTIGIFAHVDAGKTTLSEQILYNTKGIRTRGRVDHKDTFLDNHSLEKERGITIFSDIGKFKHKASEYFLIDTPGHIDFSPEMERAIAVLDYAVLVISAVEGIQGHTETVWRLLRKRKVPVFIFINKIDREGSDLSSVVENLRNKFSKDLLMLSKFEIHSLIQENIEFIAEYDEELLKLYLEEKYSENKWLATLKALIKKGTIVPVLRGSALQNEGVKDFLDYLEELSYTDYESSGGSLKAKVYKVKYDEKGTRITFIKILEGILRVKDEVEYFKGEEAIREKVNEIRSYSGSKYEVCDRALPGEIVGITGITELRAGMGIGIKEEEAYTMVPALKAKVIYDKGVNPREVLKAFRILETEEGSLNVNWSEELQELHISIMGAIQLEVLKEVLKERFSLSIEFGTPEILYKETIKGKTDAFGHFEPLRHYAEVYLQLEEGPRGSGIIFENKCHPDFLSTGHQNLIKTHIFEREHKGILTGSGLTDIKVTLIKGRAHLKHTEGGDFREATKRALRQGLESIENVLLEPYYKFKIDVNINLMGRVLSDIQKMCGQFQEPVAYSDRIIIEGRGPVATFMNYPLEFQAFTKGKGALTLTFEGYDICHNSEEIIKTIGYNKDADPEYTSSSMFCAKGVGYSVPWNEVKNYMHVLN